MGGNRDQTNRWAVNWHYRKIAMGGKTCCLVVLKMLVVLTLVNLRRDDSFSGPLQASDDKAAKNLSHGESDGGANRAKQVSAWQPEYEDYKQSLRILGGGADHPNSFVKAVPAEISEEKQCPAGTVRRRLNFRMLVKLRKVFPKRVRRLRATWKTPGKLRQAWKGLARRSSSDREKSIVGAVNAAKFQYCNNLHLGEHPMKNLNFKNLSRRPVKIVLGIMSATPQCSLRNAHRMTWQTYKRICDLKDYEDPMCELFPVFVLAGKSEGIVEMAPNMVFLKNVHQAKVSNSTYMYNFRSSMWQESNAKTPRWFNFSLEAYPWATHIGKMDLDTLPDIELVHHLIARVPAERLYYGRRMDPAWGGIGGMFGEFYMMSADLVRCFAKLANRQIKAWGYKEEDQVTAKVLCKQHDCVPVNVLESRQRLWVHYWMGH